MDNASILQEISSTLDELLFWIKFTYYERVQDYFSRVLDTDQKREVYNLSDGKNSISKIIKETSVKSSQTISVWWSEWLSLGIVRESLEYKGRKEKIIELSKVGL